MVQFTLFTTAAAALAVAQGALAAPAASGNATTTKLAKRAEGVHLFNCHPQQNQGNWLSIVAYCANDADCSNGAYNLPDADVCIMRSDTTPGVFHIWEGHNTPQQCTFAATGVTFSWDLPANAQSYPDYTAVGSGSNGFRSFVGHKDDKTLGASYNGYGCQKIYYFI